MQTIKNTGDFFKGSTCHYYITNMRGQVSNMTSTSDRGFKIGRINNWIPLNALWTMF